VEESPLTFKLHYNGSSWESSDINTFSLNLPEIETITEHAVKVELLSNRRIVSQGSAVYSVQEEVQVNVPLSPKGEVSLNFLHLKQSDVIFE